MAAAMDYQVTRAEKQRRASMMQKELSAVSLSVMESFMGEKVRVILEQQLPDGTYSGYTDEYLPAIVTAEGADRNDIVTGTVSAVKNGSVTLTSGT